jgi:hypothetical protein
MKHGGNPFLIVYKKRMTTKQSYKKVPAISISIYTKWTKSRDKEISDYWKMKSQEEGEHELSEFGKRELEEALLDIKESRIKVFDNVKDLMKDLNE